MKTDRRIVNNRVFLLGLDELYREAMKRHERGELLRCARETASALSVAPADIPIEGYYSEDERLTEYFRLVRSLQQVPKGRESELADLAGFKRLRQVTESPIFGPPFNGQFLLSVGEDALSVALKRTFPAWTVENLTNAAYDCAAGSSDFSLVTLAALSRDAVVLTALRESVVLYAMAVGGSAVWSEPEYVWDVDEIVQQRTTQFVDTFNQLFGERLPRPAPDNAKEFWMASSEWKVIGRCVRVGFDDSVRPIRHCHWAIDTDAKYRPVVNEFWDTEIWTTARYRSEQEAKKRRRP
ncbi:MAG: hypothetical protein L0211_13570 [Planctomycetaceae bacterium]|nr:hypothetical protein [Planctomycetaceae bacterium]